MLKSYIFLIFGVLALSLSSLFIHWAQAPGIITSFYRMTFATLILLPILFKMHRGNYRFDKKYLIFPIIAGVFTALDHAFWSTSINFTKIANATLFNNISPIWVSLFGFIFLNERFQKKYYFGLFATITGVIIIYGANLISQSSLSIGDGLAIISSIFYAGYFIVTQKGRKHYNTLFYLFVVQLTAAITLLFTAKLNSFPIIGYSSVDYLIFLGAAVISQIGGYYSISYALGKLPASFVSPTMVAQPLITSLLAIPLANELLVINQIIGGILILIGIFLINYRQNKNNS